MAKSNITRKQARELAIHVLSTTREDWDAAPLEDAVEVLTKMHEQLSKPREKAVSKARMQNENIVKDIINRIPADGLTSKEIVNLGNPAITTTQKAVAVMRVAEEMGFISKVKEGKKISYVPVEVE